MSTITSYYIVTTSENARSLEKGLKEKGDGKVHCLTHYTFKEKAPDLEKEGFYPDMLKNADAIMSIISEDDSEIIKDIVEQNMGQFQYVLCATKDQYIARTIVSTLTDNDISCRMEQVPYQTLNREKRNTHTVPLWKIYVNDSFESTFKEMMMQKEAMFETIEEFQPFDNIAFLQ